MVSSFLLLNAVDLSNTLKFAENELFNSRKIKFVKSAKWRNNNVPDLAGIYAIFDNDNRLIYIGESGNLRKRMSEIGRTVNHTFRKQIGFVYFGGEKCSRKYDDIIEKKLDNYFEENIYISFLPVNFGRLEIETYLVSRNQSTILNSVKKRK
jgi:hypothetical protein